VTIAVVIPAFNAARYVATAIASVQSQSRAADELLVVDDGSTDSTGEICAKIPGTRYVKRINGGLAAARNTGIRETTSEWLLFLDADDVLLPGALEALSQTAETSKAGVVYGFVLQRRGDALEPRLHGLASAVGEPPLPAKAHFWWTAIPTAGAAMIRRSLNEAVGGFDESFRQVEDAEYWLRCGVTASFAHCNAVVLDKMCAPESLGQNTARSIWYRLQLQRKFLGWCAARGIDVSFLGVRNCDLVNHALKRAHFEKAPAVVEPLLEQAREMAVRTPWYWRSLIAAKLNGVTADRGTFPVVHHLWRQGRK